MTFLFRNSFRIVLLLSMIFIHYSGFCQDNHKDYFVGDTLAAVPKEIQLITTKTISAPFVSFKERNYTLQVSKSDLLNSLNFYLNENERTGEKDFARLNRKAINFLNSKKNLSFDYVWAKALGSEAMGWKEAEKAGNRILTRHILRQHICELIDAGKFQVIENGKLRDQYFFHRVISNYGGNVKGVFTNTRKMIWICPPFEID